MLLRRQVLVGGGAGVAAFGAGQFSGGDANAGKAPVAESAGLFLIDSSITGAAEAANVSAKGRVPIIHYKGDIGAPWLDHLEPAWRRAPSPVIGATYGGAFFCLEQLARSYGLSCIFRFFLPMNRRDNSVHPFVAGGQSVSSNGAAQGAGIGALFSSALRLAALGPAHREKAVIVDEDGAGDRPLVWLLQPGTVRGRAG